MRRVEAARGHRTHERRDRTTLGGSRCGAPAILDDRLFRSISAELRSQQGPDFTARDSTLNVRQGRRGVSGVDTDFTDDDRDREINIGGAVYRIQDVVVTSHIVLADADAGVDGGGAPFSVRPFSVGPKLVDPPWTDRIPSSLVYLRGDDSLPNPAAGKP